MCALFCTTLCNNKIKFHILIEGLQKFTYVIIIITPVTSPYLEKAWGQWAYNKRWLMIPYNMFYGNRASGMNMTHGHVFLCDIQFYNTYLLWSLSINTDQFRETFNNTYSFVNSKRQENLRKPHETIRDGLERLQLQGTSLILSYFVMSQQPTSQHS